MTTLDVVLATVVMLAAASLQGAIGFGANLFAGPLLLLISARFVPGPMIVAAGILNLLVARREGNAAVDTRVMTAVWGQVAGAVAAGVTIAVVSERVLSLLFAGVVLLAVVLSAAGWVLELSRASLIGAGTAAGFMGTVAGIGGPPMALLYQRADAATLRATMARFFIAGTIVSVTTLLVVGELDGGAVGPTLWLLPGMVGGFLLSRHLAGRLDRGSARPAVLILSGLSAVAVVLRELL